MRFGLGPGRAGRSRQAEAGATSEVLRAVDKLAAHIRS